MVPFCRLLSALSEVPDPRRAEGRRYPLAPLLLFTVLALLSGATSYRRIIIFLDQRRLALNAVFGVALKRAPSLNTLRSVLQEVDGDALEQAFRRHAEGLLPVTEPGRMALVALDGFGEAVRSHWGIENRSHYVRDVTFGEDASRTRIKPTHYRPLPKLRDQHPAR